MSFERRQKYPRTLHLPWSPGASSDDLRMRKVPVFTGNGAHDVTIFEGQEVIVTEKMDGENTTLYSDGLHARSLDSRHHPSRTWIKRRQAEIGYLIPEGWRVCGENLYARHSIAYEGLSSWFMAFSVWNDQEQCLSWDETLEWVELLGLEPVPVLFRGVWRDADWRDLDPSSERVEGYVVRTAGAFARRDFSSCVAKFVRSGHVQTDQHWMHSAVVVNGLQTK